MPVKRIFNASERRTQVKLVEICEHNGVSVYPKMRIADLLPIEGSGICDEDYRYALQAHFDFVVADNDLPIFALEFDGAVHDSPEQKSRDAQKNRLCDRFELPLLRINSRYIDSQFRGMDLLTWFIEVWFLREAFFQAQESGSVPMEEIFDPSWFMNSRKSNPFPYWLSRDALLRIQALKKAGIVRDFAPSYAIGLDAEGNYRALMWLRISTENWVLIRTGMREQRFPVVISELISDLAVIDLEQALHEMLSGKRLPTTGSELDREIKAFEAKYNVREVHCSG